jgi:hypothetical protein
MSSTILLPHAHSFVLGTAVINTHTYGLDPGRKSNSALLLVFEDSATKTPTTTTPPSTTTRTTVSEWVRILRVVSRLPRASDDGVDVLRNGVDVLRNGVNDHYTGLVQQTTVVNSGLVQLTTNYYGASPCAIAALACVLSSEATLLEAKWRPPPYPRPTRPCLARRKHADFSL